MANFQFNVDIGRYAAKLKLDVRAVGRRIMFDVHNRVTLMTPVDTGRARASWVISQDEPSEFVQPPDYRGGAGKALSDSRASQASIGREGWDRLFVTNNVEYIQALENGHSKQAPAGMVAVTLAGVQAEVQAILE